MGQTITVGYAGVDGFTYHALVDGMRPVVSQALVDVVPVLSGSPDMLDFLALGADVRIPRSTLPSSAAPPMQAASVSGSASSIAGTQRKGPPDCSPTSRARSVSVGLHYVERQQAHGATWTAADIARATDLLDGVTSTPQSVLMGIRNADAAIAAHDIA